MIICLLEAMLKSSHIHVNNYNKIREVTQEKDKNTALFLSWLTEAVQKYTNLDIFTPARLLYLQVQFISQSAPDIHRKLHQLEKGPETPQRDLLEIAFKVFNNREEEVKKEKEKERKAKYALFAAAIPEKNSTPLAHQHQPTHMGPKPPGPCFICNQMGHWAKSCPKPQPPTKPCPTCKQWGQWKMDCPRSQPTKSQGPPQAQQPWARNQTQRGPGTPDHGSLDETRDDPIVPELFQ
jgi:hypothetical protein